MKILLVQTSFIGDVVLSTPVIDNLRVFYPEAEIHTLTTPLSEELWKFHPAVSKTHAYDKRGKDRGWAGFWRMWCLLRREKYDIVFSLHKSLRTSCLLRAALIPLRYGFREAAGRVFYTLTARRSDLSHDVLRNLAIFRVLGREPAELLQRLELYRPAEIKREVDVLLAGWGQRFVGVAPGSVWATKRWTARGFAEVVRELVGRGERVVLLGGPADVSAAEDLLSELNDTSAVLNLVGRTSLLQSVEVVSRCAALLTNDSAPLHFASACRVPVVALFCATIPEFGFGPWQVPAECLGVEELSCRPCGAHGGQLCPTGTHACQLNLKSERVIGALDRMLERYQPRIPHAA